MKIMLIAVLLFCLMFAASDTEAAANPAEKFWRGVVNVVTAPVEIPKQIRASWIEGAKKTDHIIVWMFSGAVWGTVQAIKRAGSGLWDVASFSVKIPDEYQSLIQPGCVFDEWPRNLDSGK